MDGASVPWADSMFPGGSAAMPRSERVARLQQGLAGSGSTAAAARVTLAPAGKAAEEAHSGCDARRGRNAESLEGSGAPGWEHDCSQGAESQGAQRFPAFTCEPGRWLSGWRFGAMAGFDVPGGPGAAASSGAGGTVAAGAAGSGSTAAAAGVTRAPAGKTAGWTRTPGFSLCCYHVNPRTYRTSSVFGGGP